MYYDDGWVHLGATDGVRILRNATVDLDTYNNLAVYLANQHDYFSLITLKFIILTSSLGLLDKPFDINHVKTTTEDFEQYSKTTNETIIGNLAENPSNYGLELMEYIIKHYPVNLEVIPLIESPNNGMQDIIARFTNNIAYMRHDDNEFYKRYDMVDKKIDILTYLIKSGRVCEQDKLYIINTLRNAVEIGFTPEQSFKLQQLRFILGQKELYDMTVSILINEGIITINDGHEKEEVVQKLMLDYNRKQSDEQLKIELQRELDKETIGLSRLRYMKYEIPQLIKKYNIK